VSRSGRLGLLKRDDSCRFSRMVGGEISASQPTLNMLDDFAFSSRCGFCLSFACSVFMAILSSPNGLNHSRPVDLTVSGEQRQPLDQCSGSNNAIYWIFRISR